jgi:hypothetical protein
MAPLKLYAQIVNQAENNPYRSIFSRTKYYLHRYINSNCTREIDL